MKSKTDIDIDLADREKMLNLFAHIPAMRYQNGNRKKHSSGVYFQEIPFDPMSGLATIDFKEAEDRGYFKLDFLNNSIYDGIEDPEYLDELASREPIWELFGYKEIVEQLAHIGNHWNIVKQHLPTSLEELAALISIIRPAKKHLIGKDWNDIMEQVWIVSEDDGYFFKKSHAHAYAMSIIVQLNFLCDNISNQSS
jgi:hypothetical protein